jgi:hypothetical protein
MVDESDPLWVRFWNVYPHRVAKKEARKAWLEIGATPALVEQMIAALAWQSLQASWVKDGGAYVPHPASWLRAERWDDEAPAAMRPQQPSTVSGCPHTPPCRNELACAHETKYPHGFPLKVAK